MYLGKKGVVCWCEGGFSLRVGDRYAKADFEEKLELMRQCGKRLSEIRRAVAAEEKQKAEKEKVKFVI